jgi:replicative DNA helicase
MDLPRKERERAIVSALLLGETMGQDYLDAHDLTPDELSDPALSATLASMIEAKDADRPVDPLTISDKLCERDRRLPFDLCEGVLPSSKIVDGWIEQQREENSQRTWSQAYHQAHKMLETGQATVAECEAMLERVRAKEERRESGIYSQREIVSEAFSAIEKAYDSGKELTIPTGLYDIDRNGLLPGELTFIAAYPSVGKTELAITMALGAASHGHGSLFISAEMSRVAVAYREMASLSGVETERIARARLSGDDFGRIAGVVSKLSDLPVWYSEATDIRKIAAQAIRMHRAHGIRLLWVDYLQLLDMVDADTEEQRVAGTGKFLKRIAIKTGISVVALSQLSNPRDGDYSRPPSDGQLRGSGQLKAHADRILMLYRPNHGSEEDDHTLIAKVAKARNGPGGVKIELRFLNGRIANAARD